MNSRNHKVSLKKPSDFFEHKKNEVLEKELAQKKVEEETKLNNKKFAYPKEYFGEDRIVVENIIEEEGEKIAVDPYLEEFTLLKGDLKKVASSIPDRTDLTEVFVEINNLKKRLNNIPEYDGHLALIRTEIVELENSINGLPTIPEEFDPSDLYENISNLKNKIQEVRSEIPTIPEPILYDDDLDEIRGLVEGVRESIPIVPEVRYYEDDLNEIIETIDSVKQTISELPEVKYYDEEVTAIEKRFGEIQKTIQELPEVKYYDKQIKEIHDVIVETNEEISNLPEVKYYDKDVKDLKKKISLVEKSIPTVPEIKYYDEDIKDIKEQISSVEDSIPTVPEVKYYDEDIKGLNEEIKNLLYKVSSIKIPDQDKYVKEVNRISDSFDNKNQELIKKVSYLEEIFEKFDLEDLTKDLVVEKKDDDLNPQYATLQDLQDHYRKFINRVQQQLASLGGGGEVNLQYLDDIVGIATNLSAYNGYVLKVDTSLNAPYKFKFAEESGSTGAGGTWTVSSVGISTTKNVGIGTTAKSGYALDVEGSARVTGILTVGRSTITLNPNTDVVTVGTGITLDASNNKILVSGNEIADSSGNANYSGIITAATLSATTGNFSGNVTIGGTLTYEDVTNIDVVGFATITKGIEVQGTGSTTTTLNVTGVSTFAGIGTFGSDVYIDGDLNVTGDISYDEVSGTNLLVTGITTLGTTIVGTAVTINSGGIDIASGVVTATTFDGNLATTNLTGTITNAQLAGSIANAKLSNDSVSFGGIEVDLGAADATPAFNLQDATAYPYGSLTGIQTNIVGDTTPQLGGNLDFNSKYITGTGGINLSGVATATTFKGNLTGDVTGDVTGDLTGSVDTGQSVISGITATKTSTSIASVDTFSASTYRSVNYQVQVVRGTNYNMTTINIIHDGTNTYMTEFGSINQPIGIATFGSDINSGNVRLLATPTSSDSTVFKITRTVTKS